MRCPAKDGKFQLRVSFFSLAFRVASTQSLERSEATRNGFWKPKYLPFLNFCFSPTDWFWRFPRLTYQQLRGNKPATSLPLADLQLQDRRLELLTYFLEREQVSLFGMGWDRFDRLPPYWRQF